MPRGDKSSYTSKQKRRARHIEKGYRKRGVSEDEAERRAWATVNARSGGGKKKSAPKKKSSRKKSGGASRKSSTASERASSARKRRSR